MRPILACLALVLIVHSASCVPVQDSKHESVEDKKNENKTNDFDEVVHRIEMDIFEDENQDNKEELKDGGNKDKMDGVTVKSERKEEVEVMKVENKSELDGVSLPRSNKVKVGLFDELENIEKKDKDDKDGNKNKKDGDPLPIDEVEIELQDKDIDDKLNAEEQNKNNDENKEQQREEVNGNVEEVNDKNEKDEVQFPINDIEDFEPLLQGDMDRQMEQLKTLANTYGKDYADQIATFDRLVRQLNGFLDIDKIHENMQKEIDTIQNLPMDITPRGGTKRVKRSAETKSNAQQEAMKKMLEKRGGTHKMTKMTKMTNTDGQEVRAARSTQDQGQDGQELCVGEHCDKAQSENRGQDGQELCVGENCENQEPKRVKRQDGDADDDDCFGADCLNQEQNGQELCIGELCGLIQEMKELCVGEQCNKIRSKRSADEHQEQEGQDLCVGEECKNVRSKRSTDDTQEQEGQELCVGEECNKIRSKRSADEHQEQDGQELCVGEECNNERSKRSADEQNNQELCVGEECNNARSKRPGEEQNEQGLCVGEECNNVRSKRSAAEPPSCKGPDCKQDNSLSKSRARRDIDLVSEPTNNDKTKKSKKDEKPGQPDCEGEECEAIADRVVEECFGPGCEEQNNEQEQEDGEGDFLPAPTPESVVKKNLEELPGKATAERVMGPDWLGLGFGPRPGGFQRPDGFHRPGGFQSGFQGGFQGPNKFGEKPKEGGEREPVMIDAKPVIHAGVDGQKTGSSLPVDLTDIHALESDAEKLLKAIEDKYQAEIGKLKLIDEKLRQLNMETDNRLDLPDDEFDMMPAFEPMLPLPKAPPPQAYHPINIPLEIREMPRKQQDEQEMGITIQPMPTDGKGNGQNERNAKENWVTPKIQDMKEGEQELGMKPIEKQNQINVDKDIKEMQKVFEDPMLKPRYQEPKQEEKKKPWGRRPIGDEVKSKPLMEEPKQKEQQQEKDDKMFDGGLLVPLKHWPIGDEESKHDEQEEGEVHPLRMEAPPMPLGQEQNGQDKQNLKKDEVKRNEEPDHGRQEEKGEKDKQAKDTGKQEEEKQRLKDEIARREKNKNENKNSTVTITELTTEHYKTEDGKTTTTVASTKVDKEEKDNDNGDKNQKDGPPRLSPGELERVGFPRDAQGMAANALPKGLQEVLPKLSKSQLLGQPSMLGIPNNNKDETNKNKTKSEEEKEQKDNSKEGEDWKKI